MNLNIAAFIKYFFKNKIKLKQKKKQKYKGPRNKSNKRCARTDRENQQTSLKDLLKGDLNKCSIMLLN